MAPNAASGGCFGVVHVDSAQDRRALANRTRSYLGGRAVSPCPRLTPFHLCSRGFQDFALARREALDSVRRNFVEDGIYFAADEFARRKFFAFRFMALPWRAFGHFDQLAWPGADVTAAHKEFFRNCAPAQVREAAENPAEVRRMGDGV